MSATGSLLKTTLRPGWHSNLGWLAAAYLADILLIDLSDDLHPLCVTKFHDPGVPDAFTGTGTNTQDLTAER